ncbi:hypothetical protein PPERSA_12355 [Pseudocohnilembus persalinus]|uniref:Gamma-glutamylcyclotransferase family protein n=1 Tax=Pseudocohnilembus persalinus TaxID=266149 RepID=A0A0V0R200_PSEPJ|nr:hypothetical protein PPERSA_12355 [Pseudocohnilembus persalinus]|eukprot:KRX08200.1 hypothetical protein PPERSA_12355 [Pseudocohnilembus persalinus]
MQEINQTKENKKMTLVFTYGTLKKGFINNHYMKRGIYLGSAKIKKQQPSLYNETAKEFDYYQIIIDKKYSVPYLFSLKKIKQEEKSFNHLHPEKVNHVKGDLFLLDDQSLEILDDFEGVPNFYNRQPLDVLVKQGNGEDIEEKNNDIKEMKQKLNQYKIPYFQNKDGIELTAQVYTCNINIKKYFGGFEKEVHSEYSLKDNDRFVDPDTDDVFGELD